MQTFKCLVFNEQSELIKEVELKEDQLILGQLEAQNINISSDCREGICGTCEVKLLSGSVLNQYGEDVNGDGETRIRPCVCYAQSDLKIQLID